MTTPNENMKLLDVLNNTYLGIITYSPLYFNLDINFCLAYNLLKNESERIAVIVTNDVEVMQNILDNKLDCKNSIEDKELRERIVIYDYENIEQLKELSRAIIIIDNIKFFNDRITSRGNAISLYRDININNNYLIITTDDTAMPEDFSKIVIEDTEIINRPIFLSFKNYFERSNKTFNFPKINNKTLHPLKLNPLQKYSLKNNIDKSKEIINNILTNAYEKEAESFIVKNQIKIKEGDDVKIPNLDDLYDFMGITEVKGQIQKQIPVILKGSPKFIRLFDCIYEDFITQNNKKHLIYVNTENDYYGISLLYTVLLREITRIKEAQPDTSYDTSYDCVLCSYENDSRLKVDLNPQNDEDMIKINEKINLIKLFNLNYNEEISDNPIETNFVFITNGNLPEFMNDNGTNIEFLKGITDFHIITMNDENDSSVCMDLISKLFKRENYKDEPSLDVHLYYISESKTMLEIFPEIIQDFNNFSKFMDKLREKYEFFFYRWDKGLKLSFNTANGLNDFEVSYD